MPSSDGASKCRSCGLKTRVVHGASFCIIISALYLGSTPLGTLPFVSYGRELGISPLENKIDRKRVLRRYLDEAEKITG